MAGVPAGVVDEAVEAAELPHRLFDQRADVVDLADVCSDEVRPPGDARVEVRLDRLALLGVAGAEDHVGAPLLDEGAHAAEADAFAAAGDDHDLLFVAHDPSP